MKLLAAAAIAAAFAAHPASKAEWWYYTCHLQTEAKNEYGFELTFFRVRLTDGRDLDAAHFAISDLARKTFLYDERLHRPFPGICGADENRLFVFLENWEAEEDSGRHHLKARMKDAEIDLTLSPEKPPISHGEKGISRKGPGPDDYSHYTSMTRLGVAGTLSLKGLGERVSGLAWFDHEDGPGGLPPDLAGWDWFSLQLDDRSELMLYRLRQKDGTISRFSSGTFVDQDGAVRHLAFSDFTIATQATWKSRRTGAVYPSRWKVSVPSQYLELAISPRLDDQELVTEKSTRVTYWEGACIASGTRSGRPVQGKSYVELTGYAPPTSTP
jgi:predicted secreted hydrolase